MSSLLFQLTVTQAESFRRTSPATGRQKRTHRRAAAAQRPETLKGHYAAKATA